MGTEGVYALIAALRPTGTLIELGGLRKQKIKSGRVSRSTVPARAVKSFVQTVLEQELGGQTKNIIGFIERVWRN